MHDGKLKSMEALRKEVHTHLMNLPPEEAKSLRARFRMEKGDDAAESDLRALARELARWKKKKP